MKTSKSNFDQQRTWSKSGTYSTTLCFSISRQPRSESQ